MLDMSTISVASSGSSFTLRLGGEVDLPVMPQLRSALAELIQRAPSGLCIDLTENAFLCLSGMGALIVLRAGLVGAGVTVVVPGATRTFRGLLAHADRVGLPGPAAKPSG